jgi:hypothetical protein
VPEGWLRAIDDALAVAHIGICDANDNYETAKTKLDALLGFHVDVATNPAVNGGYKLVPIDLTDEMIKAGQDSPLAGFEDEDAPDDYRAVWKSMLAAAPEGEVLLDLIQDTIDRLHDYLTTAEKDSKQKQARIGRLRRLSDLIESKPEAKP